MFHLVVIDIATILRVNCKTHSHHLNSWGERNLVLIARRLCDDHMLDMSSIPVYHLHVRACPFLP